LASWIRERLRSVPDIVAIQAGVVALLGDFKDQGSKAGAEGAHLPVRRLMMN
jgi:hypothetical protein